MRPPAWLIVVFVGVALGLTFAAVASYDFVKHLDRQEPSLPCSFIPGMGPGTGSSGCQAAMFGAGVAFVVVPVVLYVEIAPDHSKFIGTCDGLPHPDDSYGIMVHVARPAGGAVPSLEILDPLCPACKAFEQRLDASGFAD